MIKYRKPIGVLGGIVLGFLVLVNGAFFVSSYFPKSVITSYSIHYTKLYEVIPFDPGHPFQ